MGILQTDAIVLDQVRSFLSNDFAIHDLTGQPVGRIVTELSLIHISEPTRPAA